MARSSRVAAAAIRGVQSAQRNTGGETIMTAMRDAYDALNYVRNSIGVKSTNNPKDFPGSLGEFDRASGERQRDLDLYTARYASLQPKKPKGSKELYVSAIGDVMAAAKAALQLRIGNCEAQAALGYFYIVEHCQSAVWLTGLRGYDHAFLMVGPPEAASPLDPSTWGDAMICDPWANAVYPAAELTAQMKSLYVRTGGGGGIEAEEDQVILSMKANSRDDGDRLTEKITG